MTRDELAESARRRSERRRRREEEGEPSLLQALAHVGSIGWLVILPTLLGIAGGRALDRVLGAHAVWSARLMLVGVLVGCWLAFRRVRRS